MPLNYYHLTQKPLRFKDVKIRQFHTNEYRPVGLYYTKYPHLMPSHLYDGICSNRSSDSRLPCYLYKFTIPAKYITTDVKKPHPLKILRITKENWLDVGFYMQTHTRAELFRDYAGLDADDIEIHTFLQRKAYTMESLTHPSNRKQVLSTKPTDNTTNRANLRWLFPHGFSGLTLDVKRYELYPEACVWRASEWLKPELVNSQTNVYDDLLSSWSDDTTKQKYDIQNSHYVWDIINWRKEESKEPYADQPLFRTLSVEYGGYKKKEVIVKHLVKYLFSTTMSPWVSLDTLYTQFKKDTGSPCSIQDFRKYYCDDYPSSHIIYKLKDNQLWVQWKLWIPNYTKKQMKEMVQQTNRMIRWFHRSFPNTIEPYGYDKEHYSPPSSDFTDLLLHIRDKINQDIADYLREWVTRLAPYEQTELFKELVPKLFTQKLSIWVLLSDLYTMYTDTNDPNTLPPVSVELFEYLLCSIPEGVKINREKQIRWTEWVPKQKDSTETIRQCIQKLET